MCSPPYGCRRSALDDLTAPAITPCDRHRWRVSRPSATGLARGRRGSDLVATHNPKGDCSMTDDQLLSDAQDELRWEPRVDNRSEEHTSELQSLRHLVCRLLLEKKK